MEDLEKALEEIVKNYLIRETSAELIKTHSGRKEPETVSENLDKTIASSKKEEENDSSEHDSEFATNIYQCLLEKGVLREVHAFIRHKLVEVLRGTYPQVIRSGCDSKYSSTVIDLVEDFLITHNLLFTYSVLMSELNGGYQSKREPGIYGKLKPGDAENLLEEINVPKDSSLSRLILKKYSEDNRSSLLDTFVELFPTKDFNIGSNCPSISSVYKSQTSPKRSTADGPPSKREWQDAGESEKPVQDIPVGESIDAKLFEMHFNMERDKSERIQNELQRFRNDEVEKIRKDVEANYAYKFLSKEQELLRAYDDRVTAMKRMMDQEKQIWHAEKAHKEKELEFQRNNLLRLMSHVREKKLKAGGGGGSDKRDVSAGTRSATGSATGIAASGCYDQLPDLPDFPTSSTSDDTENFTQKLNRYTTNNGYMASKDEPGRRKNTVRFSTDPWENEPETSRSKPVKQVAPPSIYMKSLADDKVAFLQMAVEHQSEEIRRLKSQVARKTNKGQTSATDSDTGAPSAPVYDSDLETFLTESKHRFAEIEKKAEVVSSTLRKVFQRNHGSTPAIVAIHPGSGSNNTTLLRNSTLTARQGQTNNFNLSITPQFLTETGSFHQNLRSFLIEDDTKMEDVLPSMLRTLPSIVPEYDTRSNTETFKSGYHKNRAAELQAKFDGPPVPFEPSPQPTKQPKLFIEESPSTSLLPPSGNSVRTAGQGDAVEVEPGESAKAQAVKKTINGNGMGPQTQVLVDRNEESNDRQTPPFMRDLMIPENGMIDDCSPVPDLFTPPSKLKAPDEPKRPVEESPVKADLENDADSRSLDSSYDMAKRAGALTRTKIPSPANSISADAPFVVNGRRKSWGHGIDPRENKQVSSQGSVVKDWHDRSDSISVVEISHADGDTSDNMAEDDFWAI